MKRQERLIFGILTAAAMLLGACTREIVEVRPQENDGQRLRISVGSDFATRSALNASGASQHIEHMYAYLFREDVPGDGTFKCFYAVDMDWTPIEGTGLPDFSYRLSKEAGLQQLGEQEIKVLVVAADNNRRNYRFPVSADGQQGDSGSHVSMQELEGMPFDDVKAVLAADAAGVNGTGAGTPEAKAWAMAHTELFSGVAGPVPANTQVIEVTVDRCVAGILCYLTDIPLMVESGEDARIRSIELHMKKGQDLNTEVTLEGQSEGSAPLHGGTAPQEEVVIASVDVSMYSEAQGDSGAEEGMLYIPATDDGTVVTLENSVLFGAYLVPVRIPEGEDSQLQTDATLNIVLRGGENLDKVSAPFYIRNESGTPTGPTEETDSRKYSYSLLSNHMYAIGTKPSAGSTVGDKPASLAGDELILSVVPWEEKFPDTDFPQYSLGACFDTDFESDYIFDCIGTGTDDLIEVTILPAIDGSSWRLDVEQTKPEPTTETVIPTWLLYRFCDENGTPVGNWHTGSFSSESLAGLGLDQTSEVRMQIAMADHVVKNPIMYGAPAGMYPTLEDQVKALQEDYRTAVFRLTTDTSMPEVMRISQYNAITAPLIDGDGDPVKDGGEVIYRGFARNDLMAPETDFGHGYDLWDDDGYSYTGWGFNTLDALYIFGAGYNTSSYRRYGEECSGRAFNTCYDSRNHHDDYIGSALYRGRKGWTEIIPDMDNNTGTLNVEDVLNDQSRVWFTPAEFELNGFFIHVVAPLKDYYATSVSAGQMIPDVNVKYDRWYWSGSPQIGRPDIRSMACKVDGSGAVLKEKDRNDVYDGDPAQAYIRQARNFE